MEAMPCVFQGCTRIGAPLEGYNYFACENCLEELEEYLNEEYENRLATVARPSLVARISMAVKL